MRFGSRWRRACEGAVWGVLASLVLAGCPSAPKELVYDLAHRALVAERWSERVVLLFGTPSTEPYLRGGFHREARVDGEPFLWAKREAELVLHLEPPLSRAAVVDLAPYEGVEEQNVEIHLNGVSVERFRLGNLRSRHLFFLPAEAQHPGENRLRFVFEQAVSPADRDPSSRDRRLLAARFYSLIVGAATDEGLQNLLRREAPRPFEVRDQEGVPSLSIVGPGGIRFALRLPPAAELRFTPELPPAAQALGGGASFRVTLEHEARPGVEEELWSRGLRGNEASPGEVSVPLPGEPGEIVRLGLHVESGDEGRVAWGAWRAPRVLGRARADLLTASPLPPGEDARADELRRKLKNANVVFVILDAARARQLGAYGYERETTPVIDGIAAEGIVFERAYTPAVYTLGAMSSVWTSQYPDRHHGDVSFSSPLPEDRLTLAEVLSGQGILTAGFVATAVPGGFNGFDRGFEEFREVWQEIGSRADVFRQVIPQWLESRADRRFFAYLHYREPHFPYDPEAPFDTKFGPDGPLPKTVRRDMEFFRDVNQGRRPFSDEEQAHLVRLYDGNLAYVDREVGELQRALVAAGVWDDTVFILTADHGEELFERGWIGHNVHVYEPSARIPLIMKLPKGVGPGPLRIEELVDLVDIAPTVVDVFGVRAEGGADREFQGRSLLPVIAGARGRPAVVSRTVWDRPRYALRDSGWSYLYETRTAREELFDTAADPDETQDVAPHRPLRAAYYREALLHWASTVFRPGAGEPEAPATMSRDQCEALKALGYVSTDQVCPES